MVNGVCVMYVCVCMVSGMCVVNSVCVMGVSCVCLHVYVVCV